MTVHARGAKAACKIAGVYSARHGQKKLHVRVPLLVLAAFSIYSNGMSLLSFWCFSPCLFFLSFAIRSA